MKSNQREEKSKALAKLVLKLALGGAAVAWVLHSKMIDFDLLSQLLRSPTALLVSFGFFGLSQLCCAVRWFLLARAQGLQLSFGVTIELTMVGVFFNTFMPGSVGGDLIKAWYVAGREPQRKTKAVFTVLLDRVLGLLVFFAVSGVALLFVRSTVAARPELALASTFIWTICSVSLVVGAVYFTPALWRLVRFDAMLAKLHRFPLLARIIDAGLLYRNHPRTVLLAIVISCFSILSSTLLYQYQGSRLGIPLSLTQYLFIVPVALTASAVPLLPGGIGVGQVAFFTLFTWVGAPNPEAGGALCTAVQIYNILFNCLGAIFYLNFRRRGTVQTTELVVPERTVA